mmetsp:Transcript_56378/g.156089  ORF Transcript_56378/g.156089 Transcript_56378/m.156089 type:complete len:180 (+) Transcript_56378:69-608(+)
MACCGSPVAAQPDRAPGVGPAGSLPSAVEATTVDAREFLARLAADMEAREDDEDWEMEDWPKHHIVSELRGLPANAAMTQVGLRAYLRFTHVAPGTAYEAIDLAKGLEAGVLDDGTVAIIEADLGEMSALRRLQEGLMGVLPQAVALAADGARSATSQVLQESQAPSEAPAPKRRRVWQ